VSPFFLSRAQLLVFVSIGLSVSSVSLEIIYFLIIIQTDQDKKSRLAAVCFHMSFGMNTKKPPEKIGLGEAAGCKSIFSLF